MGLTRADEELGRFSRRQLDCEYPYCILDARYEKVRENAVIRSRAVQFFRAWLGLAKRAKRNISGHAR